MAEMSWLRSFQRTRSHQPLTGPGPRAAEMNTSPMFDDAPRPSPKSKARSSTPDSNNMQHRQTSSPVRPRPTQRVSSLFGGIGAFGFGTRGANVASPSSMDELDANFRYRSRHRGYDFVVGDGYIPEARAAWHNPSLLQMVETLQAEMMSKRDPLTPIPVV